MLLAIIHLLIICFKFLIISIFTPNQLFFKLVLTIILITILYKYYTKHQKDDLISLLEYYKIKNNIDKIFSFSIIIIYLTAFICGILFLRIYNMNRTVNIRAIYHSIYTSLNQCDIFTNIINLTFLFILIICYIYITYRFTKYTKKHIIKLHLYYANDDKRFYHKYIYTKFYLFDVRRLIPLMELFVTNTKFNINFKFLNHQLFGFPLWYHIPVLLVNFHYILMVNTFIYDMLCNNYTLYYTYKILPYIFVYSLYIKVTSFYGNLNFTADGMIYNLTYYDIIEVTEEEIFIKIPDCEELWNYSSESVREVHIYLKYGLNGLIYDRIQNPNNITWFPAYNYIIDWKYRNKYV